MPDPTIPFFPVRKAFFFFSFLFYQFLSECPNANEMLNRTFHLTIRSTIVERMGVPASSVLETKAHRREKIIDCFFVH